MDASEVAVATITWARSPEEEALLVRSLRRLAVAGLPVAVADAGTSPAFTSFLTGLPGFRVTLPAARGLVAQVQGSFAVAASFERRFILYAEPDKELFFEHGMSRFLSGIHAESDLGVALAARSAWSFQTYPPMQRYTEGVINHLCAERLGIAGDYSYGPFLANRALLPGVATLEHHLGWGWRHATFVAAQRIGLRVLLAADDYPCPPGQQMEDETDRLHRMRQLSQNILGLVGAV